MRAKEQKLVITFHTTTEAIAMEKNCKEDKLPGRLIPIPRQLSSGCGLAWCMPPEWRGPITEYMEIHKLNRERMEELLL